MLPLNTTHHRSRRPEREEASKRPWPNPPGGSTCSDASVGSPPGKSIWVPGGLFWKVTWVRRCLGSTLRPSSAGPGETQWAGLGLGLPWALRGAAPGRVRAGGGAVAQRPGPSLLCLSPGPAPLLPSLPPRSLPPLSLGAGVGGSLA